MQFSFHMFFHYVILNRRISDKEIIMNNIFSTYMCMIRNTCSTQKGNITIHPEDVPSLLTLAQKHFTSPFLLPYMKSFPEAFPALKQQTKMAMYQYYQIEHFTELTVSLLDQNEIPYYLLKGISLAACYPVPEYRKLGDVDLYIPDPDAFKKAGHILEAHGFILDPEVSDHHSTYLYTFPKTGRTYMLELHFRIVGVYQYGNANQIVDQVFASTALTPELQTTGSRTYRVLPPTEYVFYMIHHMLKHYLYSGFGIRLLCDFTLYLNAHGSSVDFSRIHTWCKGSHIIHFYEIIIACCRQYLGLSGSVDPDTHYEHPEVLDTFIQKVLEDRDMGTSNDTALVGSGSYQKINLWTYFREGHLQMKVRFLKLHKCILLWPVLWGITLICFIWNTYHYRNTTLKDTLAAFRKTNEESQLIRVFENED